MKRNKRNPEKTRREIIERSAPVFNIHGYAGTKMQMLVDATGFQMGGIYRHFETKKDLARAAFRYNYEIIIKQNLQVDPVLNPKEQLLMIFDNYKRMILRPTIAGGCPLLNTATEVDDTDEEFRLLIKSCFQEVVAKIEAIISKGKATGFFASTIEPKKEALFLFASVQGTIMLGSVVRDRQVILDIFDRVQHYINVNIL